MEKGLEMPEETVLTGVEERTPFSIIATSPVTVEETTMTLPAEIFPVTVELFKLTLLPPAEIPATTELVTVTFPVTVEPATTALPAETFPVTVRFRKVMLLPPAITLPVNI